MDDQNPGEVPRSSVDRSQPTRIVQAQMASVRFHQSAMPEILQDDVDGLPRQVSEIRQIALAETEWDHAPLSVRDAVLMGKVAQRVLTATERLDRS